jgi:hypothetical protein
LAGFTAADFTAAVSMGVRSITTALEALTTGGAGTMAGTVDDTAGGGAVPDWLGRIMIIRGGVMIIRGALIRITATTATPSLMLAKPGTTVPTRPDITRM